MRRTGKAGLILLLAGGLSAGGLYIWQRLRQFAPTRPKDAKDAAHILLQGEQKVLAFFTRPDELELFAGGVLRRLHHLGNSITVVDCSEDDSRYSQDQAPRRRQYGLSGSIMGYAGVRHLRLPARTPGEDGLKGQVRELIDREEPQLVLTFDHAHIHPWLRRREHIALGEAVVHALNEKDSDALVYLYASAKPNVLVDIGPVISQKAWALAKRAGDLPGYRRRGAELLTRRLAAITARGSGYRYAEAFRSLHNIHTFVPPTAKMPPQKTKTRQPGANPPI